MDNGAIGFFLFFVILIIIWIFAMGGCVRERNSLEGYNEMKKVPDNLYNFIDSSKSSDYMDYWGGIKVKYPFL